MISYNDIAIKEYEKNWRQNLPFEKFNNKNILITGANGLIASEIIDTLMYFSEKKNLRINIYALCRNSVKAKKRFKEYLESKIFHLVIQDVCENIKIDKKTHYIIHAASNAHPVAYSNSPTETLKTNTIGTINLLEYAKDTGTERFLYISSSEVYGECESYKNGYPETIFGGVDTLNPRSCYPESKRLAETACASYLAEYKLNTLIVRPGHVYGANITEDNSRADAQFLRNVLENQDIIMKSEGEQIRSYCYVADAVSSILAVLLCGVPGEAYNIANPNVVASIRQFAETMAFTGNVKLCFEIPQIEERKGYTTMKNSFLNAEKVMKLGWRPNYDLTQGIKQTYLIAKINKKNEMEL